MSYELVKQCVIELLETHGPLRIGFIRDLLASQRVLVDVDEHTGMLQEFMRRMRVEEGLIEWNDGFYSLVR